MSDSTTIARPYAKAVFEHALAEKKLAEWSGILQVLAEAMLTSEASDFISNPLSTEEQHIDLLMTVVNKAKLAKDTQTVKNLLSLLAHNKRLNILPDIKCMYEVHRAEQEKTLEVDVLSYSQLSEQQLKQMATSLSQRLQREVSLNNKVDPSLIGGAVIQAGDLVIDGSVRGKLNKLRTGLAA